MKKRKNPISRVFLGCFSKIRTFPVYLQHPNLMWNFQKIQWTNLEKTWLLTDEMTDWMTVVISKTIFWLRRFQEKWFLCILNLMLFFKFSNDILYLAKACQRKATTQSDENFMWICFYFILELSFCVQS